MTWPRLRDEGGFTLVELLVAAAMSVIVVGGAAAMLISAVRAQPQISQQSQSVSTARWVLERMTREIRNGVEVDAERSTGSTVSFTTRLRRETCGGEVEEQPDVAARECQVTYTCAVPAAEPDNGYCSRVEAEPGVFEGPARRVIEGLDDADVFSYSSSSSGDPNYIGVTFHVPNPRGPGALSITDGASLRTVTLLE